MFTRRNFLKGLGLGLSTPWLYPLLRDVYAADPASVPCRFVFLVEGNGIEPNTFFSQAMRDHLLSETGVDLGAERQTYRRYKHDTAQVVNNAGLADAPVLGALGDIDGSGSLESEAAVLLGISSKITGGGHETNFGALSCAFAPGRPTHPTIDHHLSTLPGVRKDTIFDAVRLTTGGRGKVAYDTCARGAGEVAPMIIDPVSAFNKLFGWLATGEGAKSFEKRGRLLALAQKDADRAVRSFGGGSDERLKLERYLEGINALIRQQNDLIARRDACAQGMQSCDFKPLEPGDDGALYTAPGPLQRMNAHTDMAISALRGGLTNVVVLGAGTGGRWGFEYDSLSSMFPKGLVGRHDVCHTSDDPVMRAIMYEATRQYVGMAARIARALRDEPEPGAPGDSMLDHTVIVVMSDNGEMHHSQAAEWPMLLIGGKKMGLKTQGRGLIYPKVGADTNRMVSDVFTTFDNLAGGVLDTDPSKPELTFGAEGDRRLIKEPLAELFV